MDKLFSYGSIAFTLVILGAVLPELLTHYLQSYSNGGVLVFSQFMGFLIGVIGMPYMVKKLGRKTSLSLVWHSSAVKCSSPSCRPGCSFLVSIAGLGAGLVESCVGTIILTAIKERQAVYEQDGSIRIRCAVHASALRLSYQQPHVDNCFLVLGLSSFALLIAWKQMSFGSIDQLLIRKEVSSADTQKKVPVIGHTDCCLLPWRVLISSFTAAVKFQLYILSLHFR